VGEFAALSNAAIWALTGVVSKGLRREVRPVHIVTAQSFATVFLFVLIAAAIGQADDVARTPLRSVLIFSASSVINTIGSLMFWVAMSRGSVSKVYPTTQSIFILASMGASWAFLNDEPHVAVILGAALIIVGVILLNYQKGGYKQAADRRAGMAAILLALVTSLMWAGGFVLTAKGLEDAGPLAAVLVRNAVPAVLFGALSLFVPWARLTKVLPGNWRRLSVVGVLFAYAGFSFTFALDNASPGVVAALTNTAPMWAMAMALVILRERLSRPAVAGAALSVFGIFIVLAFR
jgi:drug/metabolite transporter (DMT)-like permease